MHHLNPRKRKAAQPDDAPAAPKPPQDAPPTPAPPAPPHHQHHPRQAWISASPHAHWVEPAPAPVPVPNKRPRIEISTVPPRARYPKRRFSPRTPVRAAPVLRAAESTASASHNAGTTAGTDAAAAPAAAPDNRRTKTHSIPETILSVILASPHVPPALPPITRHTLRELDLGVILQNPVIRHDLLFDPGLQFRPRRARSLAEHYWAAVAREAASGCTCITLDARGALRPTACVCALELVEEKEKGSGNGSNGDVGTENQNGQRYVTPRRQGVCVVCVASLEEGLDPGYTIRSPPRLPALLAELRAVLLLVVQPLRRPDGAALETRVPESGEEKGVACEVQEKEKEQEREREKKRGREVERAEKEHEYTAHAAALAALVDPIALYDAVRAGWPRRLRHSKHPYHEPLPLLPPALTAAPLFARIGGTLRQHCAPMRDARVDDMVTAAEHPGPRAFAAVRMCLELLEVMKLDIANHQLTQLRPWLLRHTAAFEARALRMRFGTPTGTPNTLATPVHTPLATPLQPPAPLTICTHTPPHAQAVSHDLSAPLHLPNTCAWLVRADGVLREKGTAGLSGWGTGIEKIGADGVETSKRDIDARGEVAVYVDEEDKERTPRAEYAALTPNQRVYLCVLRGVVDLVFDGVDILPTPETPTGSTLTSPITPAMPTVPSSLSLAPLSTGVTLPGSTPFPETLYLDRTRLARLGADATDARALAMFTLLFRTLTGSGGAAGPSKLARDSALAQMKRELRDICPTGMGPGASFVHPEEEEGTDTTLAQDTALQKSALGNGAVTPSTTMALTPAERAERRKLRADLALQVARRAGELRAAPKAPTTDMDTSADSCSCSLPSCTPPALLAIAQKWAAAHMQPGAPLATLVHARLREAVFAEVVARVSRVFGLGAAAIGNGTGAQSPVGSGQPARAQDLARLSAMQAGRGPVGGTPAHTHTHTHTYTHTHSSVPLFVSASVSPSPPPSGPVLAPDAPGLAGVGDEVRRLAERVARLAAVHLHTHLPMYEAEGLLA